MIVGSLWRWKCSHEIMVYVGTLHGWHQFELADKRGEIWCEVLDLDMYMLEEVK